MAAHKQPLPPICIADLILPSENNKSDIKMFRRMYVNCRFLASRLRYCSILNSKHFAREFPSRFNSDSLSVLGLSQERAWRIAGAMRFFVAMAGAGISAGWWQGILKGIEGDAPPWVQPRAWISVTQLRLQSLRCFCTRY